MVGAHDTGWWVVERSQSRATPPRGHRAALLLWATFLITQLLAVATVWSMPLDDAGPAVGAPFVWAVAGVAVLSAVAGLVAAWPGLAVPRWVAHATIALLSVTTGLVITLMITVIVGNLPEAFPLLALAAFGGAALTRAVHRSTARQIHRR